MREVSPALADPAYTADKVVNLFFKDKAASDAFKTESKTRAICIGTAAECPTPKPPAPSNFDLLVNFDFNSDQLTETAKQNLDQFAKALRGSSAEGGEIRDRRLY